MTTQEERRYAQIGLDRIVHLKWLEQTASLVLAGNDDVTIKAILQSDLKNSFRSSNTNVRGSMDKSITILLKVWVRTPAELEQLHVASLELLKSLPQSEQMAVHWGMAVYPFWSRVAAQVGRLLRLQGSAAAVHIQRRLREQYGERETVSRRARYVLRSYVDWAVLTETGGRGTYSAGPSIYIEDSRLIAWLVEAQLHARINDSAPLKELLEGPSLFPYRLKQMGAETLLSASSRLELLRHGLDDQLVMLRQ